MSTKQPESFTWRLHAPRRKSSLCTETKGPVIHEDHLYSQTVFTLLRLAVLLISDKFSQTHTVSARMSILLSTDVFITVVHGGERDTSR